MRIDCARVPELAQKLKSDAEACRTVSAEIETQCRRLTENSGTEEIVRRLTRQVKLLETQGERLERFAAALGRIAEVYSSGEVRIADRAELGDVSSPSASSYAETWNARLPDGAGGVSITLNQPNGRRKWTAK